MHQLYNAMIEIDMYKIFYVSKSHSKQGSLSLNINYASRPVKRYKTSW
ncbi:hypothetical protein THZG08_850004 [Vibrio owensii]|nr:hypothetical protein THZG08_850004 [Vibrio owensii]CAH1593223.1 hypothetical protein THOA03_840004 [Vibrio owensii]